MKKLLATSLIILSATNTGLASDFIPQETIVEVYEKNLYSQKIVGDCSARNIRAQLDDATIRGRAVTTVVECESAEPVPEPVKRKAIQSVQPVCNDCKPELEVITNRKYFVTETRETFKPVTRYVSAGTYTITREICGNKVCK